MLQYLWPTGLSCSTSCGVFLDQESSPCTRFLPTVPPGKSTALIFKIYYFLKSKYVQIFTATHMDIKNASYHTGAVTLLNCKKVKRSRKYQQEEPWLLSQTNQVLACVLFQGSASLNPVFLICRIKQLNQVTLEASFVCSGGSSVNCVLALWIIIYHLRLGYFTVILGVTAGCSARFQLITQLVIPFSFIPFVFSVGCNKIALTFFSNGCLASSDIFLIPHCLANSKQQRLWLLTQCSLIFPLLLMVRGLTLSG